MKISKIKNFFEFKLYVLMKVGKFMKNDIDMKLYYEYLNGNKDAFEMLYNKYKDKITYFIYNIINDYEKSEDITQDVFIYILRKVIVSNIIYI